MDSINKQQEEKNHQNLYGPEAAEKIKELAGKSKVCFFCTNMTADRAFATRPMSVLDLNDDGSLWFLSANDSHKNMETASDSHVQLLFKGSEYADFLSLYGKAVLVNDREKLKELWNPMFKTWFTEGIDDPRITIIKVIPESGYYWDTKHNQAVGFIKRVAGAIAGKTLDDSIEGKLKV